MSPTRKLLIEYMNSDDPDVLDRICQQLYELGIFGLNKQAADLERLERQLDELAKPAKGGGE
jgi:hypothetical protein